MESVAWLAGEKHSDGPRSTSPVIAAFVRSFNDVIPTDQGREYFLRPWIPRCVNTVGSDALEKRRVLLVVDFMVRGLLPAALRTDGRVKEADEITELRPIQTETDAILAGLAVYQECGHREVSWAIKFATRGMAPSLWVPTAAKLIEKIDTPAAYAMGVVLLEQLIWAGSVARATPPSR